MPLFGPEGDLQDEAALAGGGQCQHMPIANVHKGHSDRNQPARQLAHRTQRHQQGSDIHSPIPVQLIGGVIESLKLKLPGRTGFKVCALRIQIPINALEVSDFLFDFRHLLFNQSCTPGAIY